MRDAELADYVCRLWQRESIERRELLSDIPFEELRADYRSRQLKAATRMVRSRAHVPLVIERGGKCVQVW